MPRAETKGETKAESLLVALACVRLLLCLLLAVACCFACCLLLRLLRAKAESRKEGSENVAYKQVAITTIDNPFDPFDEYEKWYRFDCDKGYNSCCYLARLTKTSDSLSDAEYNQEVERAVDAIVRDDPLKIYRKVERIVGDSD